MRLTRFFPFVTHSVHFLILEATSGYHPLITHHSMLWFTLFLLAFAGTTTTTIISRGPQRRCISLTTQLMLLHHCQLRQGKQSPQYRPVDVESDRLVERISIYSNWPFCRTDEIWYVVLLTLHVDLALPSTRQSSCSTPYILTIVFCSEVGQKFVIRRRCSVIEMNREGVTW